MGRLGCAVCQTPLQPFAYKAIGLCNPCRRLVANVTKKKREQVDCETIGIFAITRNLTQTEIRDFFGEAVAKGIKHA